VKREQDQVHLKKFVSQFFFSLKNEVWLAHYLNNSQRNEISFLTVIISNDWI
jgi:hypothetical protein